MTKDVARPRIPTDVWVLVAAAFVVAIGYGLVAPVLPQFAQSFDVSVTAASVVVSIFAFFRLIFAPLGGSLVDRLGERRVYMSGLLIVALSTGAAGFSQTYWQLLLFRGLGGLGSTMFTISAMALVVRLSPPAARGRVAGVYASAFLFGGVAGPVLGGALGNFGMRLPFFAYAGLLVVATIVVAVFLREGRARSTTDGKNESQPALTVREAIRDRAYVLSLVSAFANGWAAFGVRVAIIPLYAASTFDHGAGVAGGALASFALGTALVVAAAGRMADRVGRKPMIITGLIVAGIATAGLALVESVVFLIVSSAVAGFGAGMVNPAQQAVVADIVGADRAAGKVMATFQMSTDLGAIIGPVAIGLVVDFFGYQVSFLVTGAILVAAGIAWLFGRETLSEAGYPGIAESS